MSTNEDRELTDEDLIVVEARARGLAHREVGRLIHRSERTARRRAAEPRVAGAIRHRRAEIAEEAVGQLGGLLTDAIAAIGEGLGEAKPADRLRAASLVISGFLKMRDQVEVDADLAQLRDLLKNGVKTPEGADQ
jgi:hypothetical protein